MGYACSARTVRNLTAFIGYHKRIPRRKFNIRPYNKPLRVAWCQERLHWTYEERKRVLWTDESSYSTAGFGHRPWVIRKPDEEYHADCGQQSPDLNLIEALWMDMETELGETWGRVGDIEVLQACLKAAWESIHYGLINW